MFKVGQIVTAKELGIYDITDYMKPLEVISSSHNLTEVKPLFDDFLPYGIRNKNGETYWIDKRAIKCKLSMLGIKI